MIMRNFILWSMLLAVAIAVGCASKGQPSAEGALAASPDSAVDDREAELRQLVRRHIESTQRTQSEAQVDLIHRRPYYYKEYGVYPSGPDSFEVDIQESESRSAPYLANVRVEKVRYATRFHRKRNEANADANFLRDTGVETLSYQWRGGAWKRVGALFVAEKTEENVNGEWVPAREEIKRTVEQEEERGWWGRSWSKITGIF